MTIEELWLNMQPLFEDVKDIKEERILEAQEKIRQELKEEIKRVENKIDEHIADNEVEYKLRIYK